MTPTHRDIAQPDEAKCPACNGVPQFPKEPECKGCKECDFTGTKAAHDKWQAIVEDAMKYAPVYDDDESCDGYEGTIWSN